MFIKKSKKRLKSGSDPIQRNKLRLARDVLDQWTGLIDQKRSGEKNGSN